MDHGASDITLVTQGSFDRLDVFADIAAAWSGPKVAVFTVYETTEEEKLEARVQYTAIQYAATSWYNVKVRR